MQQVCRLNVFLRKATHSTKKFTTCNSAIRHFNKFKMQKKLAAFDFDHTIIEQNSDVVAVDLLSRDKVPQSLKQLHRTDGWTAFMQGIFELLYKNDIDEITIRQTMQDLKPTEGMCELIKELSEKLNFDVIIISDSNSYFINTWLASNNLQTNVLKVFTNPARFKNGLLTIEMYHYQESCKLSTKNLCKGQILQDFIDCQKANNVFYDQVLYVGDGTNDFCPIVRLNEQDLACAKAKFKCADLVNLTKDKKPIDSTGIVYNIKSNVLFWNTGFDILQAVKSCEMKNGISEEKCKCSEEIVVIGAMLPVNEAIFYRPKDKIIHADSVRKNLNTKEVIILVY